MELTSQFKSNKQYIKGQEDEVDDALSRTTINALTPSAMDYHSLTKLQEMEIKLNKLESNDTTSLESEDDHFSSAKVICDMLKANRDHPLRNHCDRRYLTACIT